MVCPERARKLRTPHPSPSMFPCPPHLFPLALPEFQPLGQQRKAEKGMSLRSASCSGDLSDRQRKSWELLTHSQLLYRWPRTQNYNLTLLWGLSLWAVGSSVNSSGCMVLEFPWIVEPGGCLENLEELWRKTPSVWFQKHQKTQHVSRENEEWLGELQLTLTLLLLFCVNYCW